TTHCSVVLFVCTLRILRRSALSLAARWLPRCAHMRRIFQWLLLSLVSTQPLFSVELSPCEAFGAARAVFVGQAGVPVVASVTFADGLRTTLKLSLVSVERAYRGAA